MAEDRQRQDNPIPHDAEHISARQACPVDAIKRFLAAEGALRNSSYAERIKELASGSDRRSA
ncbi:MAG: hypothetical protein CL946_04460 [Ectothiorhodospiraceae bacterium]|nr:hypothetical protein [Ectothiorhodospiraceae bacterium]